MLLKIDHFFHPLDELESYVMFLVKSLYRRGGYFHVRVCAMEELRSLLKGEVCPVFQRLFTEEIIYVVLSQSQSLAVV